MAIYCNVGGVQKELGSVYANIDGAQRAMSNIYANVGGAQKEIYAGYKEVAASSLTRGQHFYMDDPQMLKAEYILTDKNYLSTTDTSGKSYSTYLMSICRVNALNSPLSSSKTFKESLTELYTSLPRATITSIIEKAVEETNKAYYDWATGSYKLGVLGYYNLIFNVDKDGWYHNSSGTWYWNDESYDMDLGGAQLFMPGYTQYVVENASPYSDSAPTSARDVTAPVSKDDGTIVNTLDGRFSYDQREYSAPYRASPMYGYVDTSGNLKYYGNNTTDDVYIQPNIVFRIDNMPKIYTK